MFFFPRNVQILFHQCVQEFFLFITSMATGTGNSRVSSDATFCFLWDSARPLPSLTNGNLFSQYCCMILVINLASLYVEVPVVDARGLKGMLVLCIFGRP